MGWNKWQKVSSNIYCYTVLINYSATLFISLPSTYSHLAAWDEVWGVSSIAIRFSLYTYMWDARMNFSLHFGGWPVSLISSLIDSLTFCRYFHVTRNIWELQRRRWRRLVNISWRNISWRKQPSKFEKKV